MSIFKPLKLVHEALRLIGLFGAQAPFQLKTRLSEKHQFLFREFFGFRYTARDFHVCTFVILSWEMMNYGPSLKILFARKYSDSKNDFGLR